MAKPIQLRLQVKDDGTAVINRVSGSINRMEKAAVGGASRMTTALQKVRTSWLGLSVAAAATGLAVKKAFDFARTAAQFQEDVGRLNQQLGRFNDSAQRLIPTMIKLAGGQLSLAEAAQLASRGLAAGLDPAGLEKFTKLADVAGDVLGLKLPEAFDTLTRAAATGRGAVLKQLGIFIDLELETDKLAKATGRTTTQVTEQEKALIGLNKILDQADTAIAKFGASQASTADKMTALTKRWEDFKLSLGFGIQTVVLGAKAAFEGMAGSISKVVAVLAASGNAVREFFGFQRSKFLDEVTAAAAGSAKDLFQRAADSFNAATTAFKAAQDPLAALTVQTGRLTGADLGLVAATATVVGSLNSEKQTLKDLQANVAPAIAAIRTLTVQQKALADQEKRLVDQRTSIVEEGQVKLRQLLKPKPADVTGLSALIRSDLLQDRFEDLEAVAKTSSGQVRDTIIGEMEELVPEMTKVLREMLPEDVVAEEVRNILGEITKLKISLVEEQTEAVRTQQELVTESLNAVARQADGIADEMGRMARRMQDQATTATADMKQKYLSLLATIAKAQAAINQTVIGAAATPAPAAAAPQPSFAHGTPFVPRDMTARIHRGEAVVPASQNPNNAAAKGLMFAGETPMISFNITVQGGGPTNETDARRFVREQVLPELQLLL